MTTTRSEAEIDRLLASTTAEYVDEESGGRGERGGGNCAWVRDRLAVLAETHKVELDRLPHKRQTLVLVLGDSDTAGQVGTPRAVATSLATFDDDRVRTHSGPPRMPACLRMFRSVPVGTSVLGLPATVTVPGFAGCLNCR